MTPVTGSLFLARHEDDRVVSTITLDNDARRDALKALLIASLYQAGYVPLDFRSNVVFELTRGEVTSGTGIGPAVNAIGLALGGLDYKIEFSAYQEQRELGVADGSGRLVSSERFRFEVRGRDIGGRLYVGDAEDVEIQ